MSIHLDNVAITQFESDVHAQFQAKGFRTRGSVRLRNGVVGLTVQFVVSGQGIAQQKAFQADVSLMNVNYTPVQCILQGWNASDLSDIFAQQEVNFDERMELVKTSAMSIGRRMDQMVIDAAAAGAIAAGGTVIANGGTGFTYSKMRQAVADLHANNAGDNEIYCLISAQAEADLMDEQKLMSAFYVNQKLIERGGLNGAHLGGVNWIVIGNMTEGGLPKSGNIRKCFMWDKQAIGMAIGVDFRTEINYVPLKTSFLVCSLFKANAVAIDPLGIVEIDLDESVAP